MRNSGREEGRIIILVLITVFTLSAFWFIALGVTGSELRIVGGKKSEAQQLFDAEAGLNAAMESFSALAGSLASDVTTAVVYNTIKDPTSSADPALQRIVANITLRPIQNENAAIAIANNQPVQKHMSTPPAGSSSGVNSTVTRRYSINSTASGKEVQAGVYRIVPK